jgi:peptidase E
LKLFSRSIDHLEVFLRRQDIIYVGGGNTANMLEIWRIHGVDEALQKAAASGSILTGPSAGGICWFESGVTDSFGTELAPLHGGLGFLEGSFCPHFDGEADREPKYKKMLREQKLQAGYAVDDGAALHFIDGDLKRVIAEKPEAEAYFMKADGSEIKTQNLERDVLR